MTSTKDTLLMLRQLYEDVQEVFENHVPDSYAKADAMDDLNSAFESAREAIKECSL